MKKYSDIKATRPTTYTNVGEDPDAKRKEERADAMHKFIMWLYGALPLFTMLVFIFLLLLFFVILPMSEMTLGYESFSQGFRDWTRAFIATASTAGVTLVTLIVYEIVKRTFKFLELFVTTKE